MGGISVVRTLKSFTEKLFFMAEMEHSRIFASLDMQTIMLDFSTPLGPTPPSTRAAYYKHSSKLELRKFGQSDEQFVQEQAQRRLAGSRNGWR